MLEFNADNIEELEAEAAKRAHEVSVEVTKSVIKALEKDVDKVVIGLLATIDMDLSVERSGYLEALETNLVRCEEAEEYELCKESIKWIKKLKK
jgi:Flp pilus assembly secretin CpaC